MFHRSVAEAQPTPTPAPASQEYPTASSRRVDELIREHAHAQSVDELPPELRDNAIIRAIVSMAPEEEARMRASIDAHREAEALYGDNAAAELAALDAGTHPLHRRKHAAP
jgi:hypothetical protein